MKSDRTITVNLPARGRVNLRAGLRRGAYASLMSVGLGLEPDDDDDADTFEPARSTEVRVRGVPGRIDDRCLRALLEAALAHGFGSPVPVLWTELRRFLERSGVAEFDFSENAEEADE